MPATWLPELAQACGLRGVEFMCTTYSEVDIPVVEPFVQRFKVASFESRDLAFVRAHVRYAKPILASVGMLDFEAVRSLVRRVPELREILHCVSSYPCPNDQLNLAAITQLHDRIGIKSGHMAVGLSDHSRSDLSGALAVMAGARTVECHIRLDDTEVSNPDYAAARDPEAARRYVRNIREAEVLRGDGHKRLMQAEQPMAPYRVMIGSPSRFWRKVVITDEPDACWEWHGRLDEHGYGLAYPNGKAGGAEAAHRMAYRMTKGPIGDSLLICHTCDNPPCVRPDHLFQGTHNDNAQDRIAKGRSRSGPPLCGSSNGRSKLTEAQVVEIRRLHALRRGRSGARGEYTVKQLALRFRVSRQTIVHIVTRRQWRHV